MKMSSLAAALCAVALLGLTTGCGEVVRLLGPGPSLAPPEERGDNPEPPPEACRELVPVAAQVPPEAEAILERELGDALHRWTMESRLGDYLVFPEGNDGLVATQQIPSCRPGDFRSRALGIDPDALLGDDTLWHIGDALVRLNEVVNPDSIPAMDRFAWPLEIARLDEGALSLVRSTGAPADAWNVSFPEGFFLTWRYAQAHLPEGARRDRRENLLEWVPSDHAELDSVEMVRVGEFVYLLLLHQDVDPYNPDALVGSPQVSVYALSYESLNNAFVPVRRDRLWTINVDDQRFVDALAVGEPYGTQFARSASLVVAGNDVWVRVNYSHTSPQDAEADPAWFRSFVLVRVQDSVDLVYRAAPEGLRSPDTFHLVNGDGQGGNITILRVARQGGVSARSVILSPLGEIQNPGFDVGREYVISRRGQRVLDAVYNRISGLHVLIADDRDPEAPEAENAEDAQKAGGGVSNPYVYLVRPRHERRDLRSLLLCAPGEHTTRSRIGTVTEWSGAACAAEFSRNSDDIGEVDFVVSQAMIFRHVFPEAPDAERFGPWRILRSWVEGYRLDHDHPANRFALGSDQ